MYFPGVQIQNTKCIFQGNKYKIQNVFSRGTNTCSTTVWLPFGRPLTTVTGLFFQKKKHLNIQKSGKLLYISRLDFQMWQHCLNSAVILIYIYIYFRCGNIASILQFSDADNRTPKLFEAVPDDKRVIPARQV